ncbi:MAG TPA: YihY/virulence factor BrkB family protein [Opitutus sp.]|nr:YihY/virulence factor BrkB family protein [Opitutus sp.]
MSSTTDQASRGAGARMLRLFGKTLQACSVDRISRLGAALAFYTTLAVAPLLVIAVAVTGVFVGEPHARQNLIGEVRELAGAQAAKAIGSIQKPATTALGASATVIGVLTLLAGGFGVFHHLQEALNSIWRIPRARGQSWLRRLRAKLFSIATVVVTGFLLLVSLVLSAVLSWLGNRGLEYIRVPAAFLEMGNDLFSFAIVTILFALIFKILPERHVAWRHVWLGAAVTAVLFTVGKALLGFYLGQAHIVSAYGAAGSLVALLLWCYYAAQIVFFGAEFTRVTMVTDGGRNLAALDLSPRRP